MRTINSRPKHTAVVTSRYWVTDMNWVGNKYVSNKKTLNLQFYCPACSHEGVFITEPHDPGPWRLRCTGCEKSLRLNNED